jgi:hypothetical protein
MEYVHRKRLFYFTVVPWVRGALWAFIVFILPDLFNIKRKGQVFKALQINECFDDGLKIITSDVSLC